MDDHRDEHRVPLIVSHVGWTPNRRTAVLVGPVAEDCRTVIERTGEARGWTILQRAIHPDHMHLFVRVWPDVSARERRAEYPDVKRRLPSLWTRSSVAATAGTVSQIQKDLAAQQGL